jgi:hypothetical protein
MKLLVSKFFQKVVHNCIPIVKNYVDDMYLATTSSQYGGNHHGKIELVDSDETYHDTQMPQTVSSDIIINNKNKGYSKKEIATFLENLGLFTNVQVPTDNYSTEDVFNQMLQQFSKRCSINLDSTSFEIPILDTDFETRFLTQEFGRNSLIQNESSIDFSEYLKTQTEGMTHRFLFFITYSVYIL